ncbi:MAG: hypothetical protein ACRDSN_11065, partial [Pseudonocardiaceae bacterium]
LCSRTVLARDVAVEMGATFPYEHPLHERIVAFVARVHDVLGVGHGPTHTEVIVAPDGEIELVELNLRFAGADVLAAMDAACGGLEDQACDAGAARLGRPGAGVPLGSVTDQLVALSTGAFPAFPARWDRFACLQYVLAPAGLRRLDSLELPSDVDLPFVKIIKPPGSELTSTDRQLDWIAGFVVCGATHAEALARADDVRRRTLVNGVPLGDDPNNIVIGR